MTTTPTWTWFRVPVALYDHLAQVGRAAVVYLVLVRHANEAGECWPSHETIAKAAGVSDRSVRDHLAILEKVGLIQRRRRRRNTDIYLLADYTKNGSPLPFKDSKNGNELPFKEPKNGSFQHQERQNSTVKNGSRLPTELEPLNYIKKKKKKKRARFVPPSFEEVKVYCLERKNQVDPQKFVDHYEARGWKFKGGQTMKDWQAAVRTWERNGFSNGNGRKTTIGAGQRHPADVHDEEGVF